MSKFMICCLVVVVGCVDSRPAMPGELYYDAATPAETQDGGVADVDAVQMPDVASFPPLPDESDAGVITSDAGLPPDDNSAPNPAGCQSDEDCREGDVCVFLPGVDPPRAECQPFFCTMDADCPAKIPFCNPAGQDADGVEKKRCYPCRGYDPRMGETGFPNPGCSPEEYLCAWGVDPDTRWSVYQCECTTWEGDSCAPIGKTCNTMTGDCE